MHVDGSEIDLDVALGGVDADADHLSARLGDGAGAQVADGAVLQPSDAGVADAHPAAELQLRAGVLAADQDGLAGLALGLAVRDAEVDAAALAARRRRCR